MFQSQFWTIILTVCWFHTIFPSPQNWGFSFGRTSFLGAFGVAPGQSPGMSCWKSSWLEWIEVQLQETWGNKGRGRYLGQKSSKRLYSWNPENPRSQEHQQIVEYTFDQNLCYNGGSRMVPVTGGCGDAERWSRKPFGFPGTLCWSTRLVGGWLVAPLRRSGWSWPSRTWWTRRV